MSSDVQKFDASFKKVPGTLSLTSTHIAWVPKSGGMDRQQQALNRIISLMTSKAGAAAVSLRLMFKDDVPAGGLTFKFTSPQKEADRQKVQDTLIPFVSANKAGAAAGPSAAAGATGSGAATPTTGSAAASPGGVSTPGGGTPASGVGTPSGLLRKRKHEDDASRRQTNKLRQAVLRKDATLKDLHRALVMSRQISEDEFWSGREALLRAEEMASSQRAGRSSRLLDDRFELTENKNKEFKGGTGVGVKKAESGPLKLNITRELTREIFEEFPVVQDAYAKHVPRITDAEFWKRYFESTLWERHRASTRKTALDGSSGKKDDIFDAYLEDPDWDVAPRKEMPDRIETYLDLAATEEDHGERSVLSDVTMQAGKERMSLPLIRRFNDHSEKLLKAGRSAALADDIMDQIAYDELNAASPAAPIGLNVQAADPLAASSTVFLPGASVEEKQALMAAEARKVSSWRLSFEEVCLPNPANPATGDSAPSAAAAEAFSFQRDAQAVATRTVRDLYIASLSAEQPLSRLPAGIVEEMKLLNNATMEFLRQYYGAIQPAPAGALGGLSAAQKAQKAARMAKYLAGTEAKVNAIVTIGEIERVDPERIRAIMAPTLGAVNVALGREAKRAPAAAAK